MLATTFEQVVMSFALPLALISMYPRQNRHLWPQRKEIKARGNLPRHMIKLG